METAQLLQIMDAAFHHHQAGRLDEAKELYSQALALNPDFSDAMHMLGAVALQEGKLDEGVNWISRAISINPNNPEYHCNLSVGLLTKGDLDGAIASAKHAITLRPDLAMAFSNLGGALERKGELDQAIDAFQHVIQLKPDNFDGHTNLGYALRRKGDYGTALASYTWAAHLQPNSAPAQNNLSSILYLLEQFDRAIATARRAIELDPSFAEAYCSLGAALERVENLPEATAAYQRALELRPDLAQAHNNLGIILQNQGRLEQALEHFNRAIEVLPHYAMPHANRAVIFQTLGQSEQAIESSRRAIQLEPDQAPAYVILAAALAELERWPEALEVMQEAVRKAPDSARAFSSLAWILRRLDRPDEAMHACGTALRLDPRSFEPYNIRGNILKDRGQVDAAIQDFRKAIQLKPDDAAVHSNLVYTAHFHPDFDADKLDQENRNWARKFEEPLLAEHKPHTNDRSPDRRLRVGYISPYFWNHAESHFMIPLLENHDRKQVEIFCYSNSTKSDPIAARFRDRADIWRNIKGITDQKVAEMIREDRIDILIDPAMHLADSRPLICARKPAPIQIAYLAYPGSTGMKSMDYLFMDSYMDPPGAAWSIYSEEPIRLPDCWCVYDPLLDIPSAAPRESGPITFGSINNPCKLNESTLRLWAKILKEIPASRLLVQSLAQEQHQQILDILDLEGIAPERIEFLGKASREPFLRYLDRIDICLDPLPYNGITTTCDALWMGVPVVSLAGKTSAGRAGNSILRTAGLADLATESEEHFIQTAVTLATDRPRLAELRIHLRQRFSQSPMMDFKRFARNVEAAYRKIWHTWCNPTGSDRML